MDTNLSFDPRLIEDAVTMSGEPIKRVAVTRALAEFIARQRQRRSRAFRNTRVTPRLRL